VTPRQARFVEVYLVDRCAVKAAGGAGYSKRTAHAKASAMLRLPDVAAASEAGQERAAREAGVDANRVLTEVAAVAYERSNPARTRWVVPWSPARS
jgi:phage terminase small subunit